MDPTARFSGKVENYVRHRPEYPAAILDFLRDECGLTGESKVADIGSGTGILSRQFLENGNQVFGVEPNEEMRLAGERLLSEYERFTSVAARAEATSLPSNGVDFVTVGQAFHWFDRALAREEFSRILVSGGWTMILWNERRKVETPFLEAYERLLLVHGTDYRETGCDRRGSVEELRDFFAPGFIKTATFTNRQVFDLDGLRGRLLSSSYAPAQGEAGYEEMLAELVRLFHDYEEEGEVNVEYDTRVYLGQFSRC